MKPTKLTHLVLVAALSMGCTEHQKLTHIDTSHEEIIEEQKQEPEFRNIIFDASLPKLRKFRAPKEYEQFVIDAANRHGVSPWLLADLIRAESGWNPRAISQKGCKGLAQIADATAKFHAARMELEQFDIYDPETNIEFGAAHLAYLSTLPYIGSDEEKMLAAYNWGHGNLKKHIIDNGFKRHILPQETRNYIAKILEY